MKYPPDSAITSVILAIPRARLKGNTKKKLDALQDTIGTFKAEIERYQRLQVPRYQNICNAALFCALLNYDLTLLLFSQMQELNPSRRRFYSRHLALSLYEASEDLPAILGKDFRISLSSLSEAATHLECLAEIRSLLSRYKADNGQLLKQIRVYCVAHRDHDAYKQLQTIESVDDSAIHHVALEMDSIFNRIIDFMLKVALDMGKLLSMLRNLKNNA